MVKLLPFLKNIDSFYVFNANKKRLNTSNTPKTYPIVLVYIELVIVNSSFFVKKLQKRCISTEKSTTL